MCLVNLDQFHLSTGIGLIVSVFPVSLAPLSVIGCYVMAEKIKRAGSVYFVQIFSTSR